MPTIRRFGGEDFRTWKYLIEIILESKNLLECIKTEKVKPEPVTQEYTNWISKDTKARVLIATSLEPNIIEQIYNCYSAKATWDRLLTIYEQSSSINRHVLEAQFHNYRMDPNDSISTHVSKIEMMARSLKDAGKTKSDQSIASKIILTLSDDYRHVISSWNNLPHDQQTTANLLPRLLVEESLNKQRKEESSSTNEQALFSSSRNKFKNKPRYTSSNSKDKEKAIADKKKNTQCGYCKVKGHWWRECNKRINEKGSSDGNNKFGRTKDVAFSAELNLVSNETKSEIWLGDSGASQHMTFNRKWFSSFKQIDEKYPITIGDGKVLYAKGRGDILIKAAISDDKWIEASLRDVLYVPELDKNLFSIGTAADKGFTIIYTADRCLIQNDGMTMAIGKRLSTNKLYKMIFKVTSPMEANSASSESIPLWLWHQRLAHVSTNTIKDMFTKQSSMELIRIKLSDQANVFCGSCAEGKQHKLSFQQSQTVKAKKSGTYIHSDVCGPMSVQSPTGSRYYINFKDEFSGYRQVYFMKKKSEALDKFKLFEIQVFNDTGTHIQHLRTDNGTEYVIKDFKEHLLRNKIQHHTTAPYTPQQNGVAERDNRTLVEAARSMIIHSKLPKLLWAEAVNVAAYTLNRVTCKKTVNSTPYEKWFGTKPSISHLRTFGCEVYVNIEKQFRDKLNSKSKRMVFVGYTEKTNTYRLWNDKERKVVISREVLFNEIDTHSRDCAIKNKSAIALDMDEELIQIYEEPNTIEDIHNDTIEDISFAQQDRDVSTDYFDAIDQHNDVIAPVAEPNDTQQQHRRESQRQ